MSDKGEDKSAGAGIFTPREQNIIIAAMIHSDGMTNLDFPAMAVRLGLTNHRSVSNAWAVIKKKIAARNEENGGGPAAPKPAAKTATKTAAATPNKRGAVAAGIDEASGDPDAIATPTPTKRARAPRKPKATPAKADGEDGGSPPKKTRRGRPAKSAAVAVIAKDAADDSSPDPVADETTAAQLSEDHKRLDQIAIEAGENLFIKKEDEEALLAIKQEVDDMELDDAAVAVPGEV
ncbi:hypothetical protein QBC35DRAFT_545422 [Podospora australis]|uniref:Uncharacterized protein n=1 Tax=Podospora australis TaxID=1536484 RepID=A0AAN7ABV8_9PEZI|nr:hypothetical protein QBC35DRAFT_545422 [Podospora australis]